ncbi:MAG: penicillin-binding protein 2 [Acidihalobacter sp.]
MSRMLKTRSPVADAGQQRRVFNLRAVGMVLFVAAMLGVAVYRLVQLQILEHRNYAQAAHNNRVRIQPVAPPRGLIYSRNGKLLAENVPSYSLVLVPDDVHHLHRTVQDLVKLLHIAPADLRHFEQLRRSTPPYRAVPLLTQLSQRQLAHFAVESYRFPGVHIQARLVRHYPYGPLTVDSVGYVGRINAAELKKVNADNYAGTDYFGKSGLELAFQSQLHGKVGYKVVKVDAAGRPLSTLQSHLPVPGRDLVLTLDMGLQRVAQKAMTGWQGAVVVMNPRNGAVLALVSKPAFNPNWFVNGISEKRYRKLLDNPRKPLWNRALDAAYSPGSTIKPFIALGALQAHVITPQKQIDAGPYYIIPGDHSHHKFWDWTPYGHGMTNLKKAIEQSVDTYFYPVAYSMGIKTIDQTLAKFGFGRLPEPGLQGESAGVLPSPKWKQHTQGQPWYPGDTVLMGIGQGYLQVTPLQLAEGVSTIAMRGHGHQPHLLRAWRTSPGGSLHPVKVQALPDAHFRKPSFWRDVIAGMHAVTASPYGTSYRAFRGFPLPVAGKTGTAQVFSFHTSPFAKHGKIPFRLRDNALFEGFTPIDKPRLAVVVVVEHAGDKLGPASNIARKVLDYWYAHQAQIENPLSQLAFKPMAPHRHRKACGPKDTAGARTAACSA